MMNQKVENQNGCLEQKENEGIDGLIDMLRTYVCDSICGCRNFGEVLETTCKECRLEEYTEQILKEYNQINAFDKSSTAQLMNKYKEIVLCKECAYSSALGYVPGYLRGSELCRITRGMSLPLKPNDGCSMGKRKE